MSSRDSEDYSILNSELAVEIMSEIGSNENRNYGSQIADELGKPQTSICRVLTELNEIDFVEKKNRQRMQYYSIDFGKIADYWHRSLVSKLEEIENSEKWVRQLEEQEEESKKFMKKFLENLLTSDRDLSGNNLNQLIYDNFVCSILHLMKQNPKFLMERPGLHRAIIATGFLRHEEGFPEVIMETLDETEGYSQEN